jgi:orotate phosphoribosyltransferase
MKKMTQLFIESGLIKTNLKKPFEMLSSKSLYPFLIERPEMLTNPKTREIIVDELVETIKKIGGQPDYIISSKKTSMPFGALVAHKLDIPFLLPHRGNVLEIKKLENDEIKFIGERCLSENKIEAIASTIPYAVPYSAIAADKYDLPLSVVNPKLNRRSSTECIEGLSHFKEPVNKVLLVEMNQYTNDVYKFDEILKEENIKFCAWKDSPPVEKQITDLTGKKIIVVEDIIRRGGTSLKLINNIYAMNGSMKAVCVFNYELIIRNSEEWQNVSVDSLCTFNEVMEELQQTKSKEEISEIHSWHANPVEWEENFLQKNNSVV